MALAHVPVHTSGIRFVEWTVKPMAICVNSTARKFFMLELLYFGVGRRWKFCNEVNAINHIKLS